MKLVSSSQVLFGTDFPFLTAQGTAAELKESNMFSAADLQAIERGNAVELMPRYKI
jgi:predicted TIM-barrel fold metal-dependent hydrolase